MLKMSTPARVAKQKGDKTMDKILTLLENDATLSAKELALMLKKEVGEVKDIIEKYEKDGVILGYQTVVDWDKTDREYVSALIEVKVMPQRDRGFDKIAEKIYNHPEVKALYLMSGGFDFTVLIEGKTMKEVAYFVAQKLAPIEFVISSNVEIISYAYCDRRFLSTLKSGSHSAQLRTIVSHFLLSFA